MFAMQKGFITIHYLLVLVEYIKEMYHNTLIFSCENETDIFSV